MTTVQDYIGRQIPWSERTFGHGLHTLGITKHIEKELGEIRAEPHSVEEWVDVVILALDGAWRAGHTPEEVAAEMERKQVVNFARRWPPPSPEDQPNEHIRDSP